MQSTSVRRVGCAAHSPVDASRKFRIFAAGGMDIPAGRMGGSLVNDEHRDQTAYANFAHPSCLTRPETPLALTSNMRESHRLGLFMDSSSYLTGAGAEATHIAAEMTRGNEREVTPGEARAARWSTCLQ